MKTLELNQLEVLEGGIDCATGLGGAVGTIVAGALLAASGPVGWGAAVYLIGAGGLFAAGGNCAGAF